MGKDKQPRHFALAIIFSPTTHRVLMITSRKHPHLWILPKGGIEEGETSGQAAIRESWEEAGTPPNLTAPSDEDRLLTLSLEAASKQKRRAVWHIHVVTVDEQAVNENTEWPEAHQREREWVTPHQCLDRIHAWYTDQSAKDELEPDVTVEISDDEGEDEQGKKGKQKKKNRKGGAMELALKTFADQYGWEKRD